MNDRVTGSVHQSPPAMVNHCYSSARAEAGGSGEGFQALAILVGETGDDTRCAFTPYPDPRPLVRGGAMRALEAPVFCGVVRNNHLESAIKPKAPESCRVASDGRIKVTGPPSLTYRFGWIGGGHESRQPVMEKQDLPLGAYIDRVRGAGWMTRRGAGRQNQREGGYQGN